MAGCFSTSSGAPCTVSWGRTFVGPGRPLEVVAPLPALARHPRGQVLLQRLDAPVHHGNGVAVLGPLRAAHGFGVQRGELVARSVGVTPP